MPLKFKSLIIILSALIIETGYCFASDNIWVSPTGSDANPGTNEKPFRTVSMAIRHARELRRLHDSSIDQGIHIFLKGGTYQQYEPLILRPEDSGTPDSPTFIEAAQGEEPIISGGINVKGWEKVHKNIAGLPKEAQGKIWSADIPDCGGHFLEFRQLWVNGQKATRASSFNDGKLPRILSVDKENETLWIPKPAVKFNNPSEMEFVIHQWWAVAFLRVKNIHVTGDSAAVTFYQPESKLEFEHPWPAPFIDKKKNMNGNSAFFFTNAIELLNQPGEWYEDLKAGKIYYWPRQGENLEKDQVIAPFLETLVQIEGSLDRPVSFINFKGINFEHTTWMRPSKYGHVPLQAGMFLLDAYKLKIPGTPDKAGLENQAWVGRQTAGVTVNNANHINFEGCTFCHMAATGLDLISGTSNDKVEGCFFHDIGGTGIQEGYFGDASFEAHLPYRPVDDRTVCQSDYISNNLITDCTNEDWGCVGIGVGFAHDIRIEHNEICNINYSGISLGWGWTKTINCMRNNRVFANKIHNFARQMYDVGGIYTLSAQPNTEISKNAIFNLEKAPYAHDPNHFQYIYFDENSSFIRATDNWSEKDKFFSNSPGPGNEWKNNGPQVADSIKAQAGLEENFRYLLEKK